MRLLLIDDNKEITEAIGFYCKSTKDKDIDCQVINVGKEGLESIRNEEFDLIMLDCLNTCYVCMAAGGIWFYLDSRRNYVQDNLPNKAVNIPSP